MKRFNSFACFLYFALLTILCACSEDSKIDELSSSSFAPENPAGNEFVFYPSADRWSIRVIPGSESDNGLIQLNSSSYRTEKFNCYYEKTSSTTASLYFFFNAYVNIGGNKIGTFHSYDYTLTFTSEHHGRYTCSYQKNNGETENLSGQFTYNTDETPEINEEKPGEDNEGDNGDNNEPDDEEGANITISNPTVSDISNTSATIKGTILADKDGVFQARGICYSTTPEPTIDSSVKNQDSDIINVDIAGLRAGTTYYVRLYAKVNNQIIYGNVISFKTTGSSEEKVDLYLVSIGEKRNVTLKAATNNVYEFGLCYGNTPQPSIYDKTTAIGYDTEWTLKLEKGKTYYIRAYYKDGTEFKYFPDSEIEVTTLGGDMDINSVITYTGQDIYGYPEYYNADLVIEYKNLPEGTYEVFCNVREGGGTYNFPKFTAYINGGSGEVEFELGFNWFGEGATNTSDVKTYVTNIETNVLYSITEYKYRRK